MTKIFDNPDVKPELDSQNTKDKETIKSKCLLTSATIPYHMCTEKYAHTDTQMEIIN